MSPSCAASGLMIGETTTPPICGIYQDMTEPTNNICPHCQRRATISEYGHLVTCEHAREAASIRDRLGVHLRVEFDAPQQIGRLPL